MITDLSGMKTPEEQGGSLRTNRNEAIDVGGVIYQWDDSQGSRLTREPPVSMTGANINRVIQKLKGEGYVAQALYGKLNEDGSEYDQLPLTVDALKATNSTEYCGLLLVLKDSSNRKGLTVLEIDRPQVSAGDGLEPWYTCRVSVPHNKINGEDLVQRVKSLVVPILPLVFDYDPNLITYRPNPLGSLG